MEKNTPIPLSFLWHPVHFLALGLGSGMPRKMPGTWGTLAALMLFYLCHFALGPITWWVHLLVVVITFIAGVYLCEKTADDLGVHDHGGIVWDEFVGMWLTLLFVPVSILGVVLAFAFFRLFDILKPWPIGWLDKRVSGGLGIMADDVLAAIYAWVATQVILLTLLMTG